ncbi:unnamed protein product [Bursaphelenchus okinawaensis]|uniref:Uncharacterized protein n=1 Tax=Bursaphelenchus okinawaensis TaxID=465554 RepID=A0A811KRK2_9BILA|nr:unnamed protein product [Bursaphelenchus okinawaensis]CAG9110318.1 unnamed protein product [Bursaphelenchus okinawaensis]
MRLSWSNDGCSFEMGPRWITLISLVDSEEFEEAWNILILKAVDEPEASEKITLISSRILKPNNDGCSKKMGPGWITLLILDSEMTPHWSSQEERPRDD